MKSEIETTKRYQDSSASYEEVLSEKRQVEYKKLQLTTRLEELRNSLGVRQNI
jgi:hypothetical protein